MFGSILLALLLGARIGGAQGASAQDRLISCLSGAEVPQARPGTPEFAISSSPHNIRLRQGVRVNARSGGHNYASHGIGGEDGHLVIDLKYLNGTAVNPATKIATVGPGARLGNMAIALDAQGKRAIPHGVCPKVGVGGHVLHGGWGYSSHNHGLFLDYLEEAEVVLADSSVVTASRSCNPDLFWALRGAGMSFGIVTSFKFRTIPQPDEIQLFYIPFIWNVTQVKAGWHIFQDYAASKGRPAEMNIRVVIASARFFGSTGNVFLFEGAYHGSKAGYAAAIQPFKDAVMALGGFADFLNFPEVTNVTYMDALLYANNNALIGTIGSAEPLESAANDQIQTNGFYKSMMTEKLGDKAVDALMTTIADGVTTNPTRNWLIITAAIGGPNSAISQIAADSTSYAHRSSLFVWEFGDLVAANETYPANVGIPWVNSFVDATENAEGKKVGMYYNYADPSIGNHSEAGKRYWPSNYGRLVDLKRHFDRNGVFENPQTVGRH